MFQFSSVILELPLLSIGQISKPVESVFWAPPLPPRYLSRFRCHVSCLELQGAAGGNCHIASSETCDDNTQIKWMASEKRKLARTLRQQQGRDSGSCSVYEATCWSHLYKCRDSYTCYIKVQSAGKNQKQSIGSELVYMDVYSFISY